MPFPVLVTTTLRMAGSYPYGESQVVSAAVNALVYSFETRDLAEDAVASVNCSNSGDFHQWATRLYRR